VKRTGSYRREGVTVTGGFGGIGMLLGAGVIVAAIGWIAQAAISRRSQSRTTVPAARTARRPG